MTYEATVHSSEAVREPFRGLPTLGSNIKFLCCPRNHYPSVPFSHNCVSNKSNRPWDGCLRYTHYLDLGYAVLEPRVGIVSQCNLHSLLIVQGTSPCFTRIRSQKMIRQPPYRRLRKPELCSIVMLSCWFTSTFKVSNRWRWSWW